MTKVTCSQHEAHEAQHMPLQETEKTLYRETGIINMKFPSNWSYTKENDNFNIFQVLSDKGSLEVDKSLVLCKGIVSYHVKKFVVPQILEFLPSLLASIAMLENVINVFDGLEVCGGVTVPNVNSKNILQKLQQIEFNEGYEDSGVWRSYSCKHLLQPPSSKFPNEIKHTACKDCRYFKDTLRKKIWNLNQQKFGDQLLKCRKARKNALKTAARKSAALKVSLFTSI
jgi:hypothetical protein